MESMSNFEAIREKMEEDEWASEVAIRAFELCYEKLVKEESCEIPESSLAELDAVPFVPGGEQEFDPVLLAQTVVIKLNGGLGTSMGLVQAKSLLPVREGKNFLNIIVDQIRSLRERTGAKVRILFMNSFNTSGDTLAHLARYADDKLADAKDVELKQNRVPKIDRTTMGPVECEEERDNEWCPPGHGDLYPALWGSGCLQELRKQGFRYAFVSNSDNLGAELDANLLAYFAETDAPFMMEVTKRTGADKKGGHLAKRKEDGRLILREVAQCPKEDEESFQDVEKHSYFNTNNLWLRLDHLEEELKSSDGVLPLPMIRNEKTVDPRDESSTPVYQLEGAMGAAIECFDGAIAVEVPRTRFAPVKTTGDLLALRSDAYRLSATGRVELDTPDGKPPVIHLSKEYKLVDSLDTLGVVPSLREARKLTIEGRVRFGEAAVFKGEVEVRNTSSEVLELNRTFENEVVSAE